jgi:hypothetical protein
MELEEFVKKTLTDIVCGVKAANKEMGGTANERFDLKPGDPISFDVAVTVTEESAKSGSAGIKVYPISLGGGKESSKLNENVTRIKFLVKPRFNLG